jgi:hypothetical protein
MVTCSSIWPVAYISGHNLWFVYIRPRLIDCELATLSLSLSLLPRCLPTGALSADARPWPRSRTTQTPHKSHSLHLCSKSLLDARLWPPEDSALHRDRVSLHNDSSGVPLQGISQGMLLPLRPSQAPRQAVSATVSAIRANPMPRKPHSSTIPQRAWD